MLLSISLINAQALVSIKSEAFTFSTGLKESIKVTFKDVNAANLTEAMKTYFDKNYKAKTNEIKKTDGEYEVENFKAVNIQQKLTSALVRIVTIENNATMYIHYKSDGYVVSEKNTPELYPAYKKMTQGIANKAFATTYTKQLEIAKRELANKEKELADFEKTEEKNASNIIKLDGGTKSTEDNISRLTADLAKQKNLVTEKAKLVSAKEIEIASLDTKSLEKDISKIEKSIKKSDKTISKSQGKIAKYQEKIKAIESTITSTESVKIESSKQIATLQTKLTNHNEEGLKNQLKLLEKDSKKALVEEKSSVEKDMVKTNDYQTEVNDAKASKLAKTKEISKLKDTVKHLESKIVNLK